MQLQCSIRLRLAGIPAVVQPLDWDGRIVGRGDRHTGYGIGEMIMAAGPNLFAGIRGFYMLNRTTLNWLGKRRIR
jgi:hypothetical protein